MIEAVETSLRWKKTIADEFGISTSKLSAILKYDGDTVHKISADNLD